MKIWVLAIEAEDIDLYISLHETEAGARREAVKIISQDFYLAGSNVEEKYRALQELEEEQGTVALIYPAELKE